MCTTSPNAMARSPALSRCATGRTCFTCSSACSGSGRAWRAKLWEVARPAAIDAGGSGSFTVNASNFAVPVYEAMGFVRTAPTQCLKGLYFNPMSLVECREPPTHAPSG